MSQPQASSSDVYTQPQEGDTWRTDAARQGKKGTQRLLAVTTGAPTQAVRSALGLPDGETVVVRRRLILADDEPVEIATSYYPGHIANGTDLAENKKIRGGAVRVLVDAGYPLDKSTEYITADRPAPDEVDILEVTADEPIIVMSRISRRADGQPVEYAVNRMVAARVAPLEYQLRNTSS